MKNRLLKRSIIILVVLLFICAFSSVVNAAGTIVSDDSLIYRIFPNTTVSSFEEQMEIQLGDNTNSTFSSISYHLYEGRNEVTTGIVKTGMVLTRGGSVMTTSKTLAVIGDVTEDGITDQRDLSAIIRHLLGLSNYVFTKAEHLKAADVNNDGIVDTRDLSNTIKYAVTDNLSYIAIPGENPVQPGPVEPSRYNLTLTLQYNASDELYLGGSSEVGEIVINPTENSNAYIKSTVVAIDGMTYDLTDATATMYYGVMGGTLKTYTKTYNLSVLEGTYISIMTNNNSEVTWNITNTLLQSTDSMSADCITIKMPSKNADITIENKCTSQTDNLQHTAYTIDNSVRNISTNIKSTNTIDNGAKELDLTLVYYTGGLGGGSSILDPVYGGTGEVIYVGEPDASEIATRTSVIINGLTFDLSNATYQSKSYQGIAGSAFYGQYTRTYKIYVQPDATVSATTDNETSVSWFYNDSRVKCGESIAFDMVDSNVNLTIKNGFTVSNDGLNRPVINVNNNVRNINGTTGLAMR